MFTHIITLTALFFIGLFRAVRFINHRECHSHWGFCHLSTPDETLLKPGLGLNHHCCPNALYLWSKASRGQLFGEKKEGKKKRKGERKNGSCQPFFLSQPGPTHPSSGSCDVLRANVDSQHSQSDYAGMGCLADGKNDLNRFEAVVV